jgi:acetylornithine/N-succinyldiaminopimelate aminotransferase
MNEWKQSYPKIITDVRGLGLLLAIEFRTEETATLITNECLARGLFVRQTQGNMIRIFPALNIKQKEMEEGLDLFREAIESLPPK